MAVVEINDELGGDFVKSFFNLQGIVRSVANSATEVMICVKNNVFSTKHFKIQHGKWNWKN